MEELSIQELKECVKGLQDLSRKMAGWCDLLSKAVSLDRSKENVDAIVAQVKSDLRDCFTASLYEDNETLNSFLNSNSIDLNEISLMFSNSINGLKEILSNDFNNVHSASEQKVKDSLSDLIRSVKAIIPPPTTELPRLQSVLPKSHTMPNNYLANELQHGGIIDAGQLSLPVLGDSRKAYKGGQLITTSIIATYQQGDGVTIKGDYTEYDRQVQDAVCSLWEYGHSSHFITSAMVYKAMTNNTTVHPSPQQIGAVTRSIEKQRRIHVQVDASAEFEKRGITDANGKPIRFKVGRFLLVLDDIEISAGGELVKGYKITLTPILLEYSKLTNQLLTVKSDLLDIKRIDSKGVICESIPNTESRIVMKGYLLRRIEVLKYDIERAKDNFRKYQSRRKKDPTLPGKTVAEFMQQSNRILFDTLFAETGQQTTDRRTQKNNRDYAIQCLAYWKATGHIKGYSIVKGERNTIRGIDLQL